MASLSDYESLTNPAAPSRGEAAHAAVTWPDDDDPSGRSEHTGVVEAGGGGAAAGRAGTGRRFGRGHALTYAGFFLFTVIVYFRPYDLIPALSSFKTMAFWVAIATLGVFVPTQLTLENNLTARPPAVNYLLLLCLMALLSVPLAVDPATSWESFNGIFLKYALMFVVMVNVARTERRLRWLLLLALAVTCTLCVSALNDYRLGNLTVEGYRVKGVMGSMLENPNEVAIHLGTMLPLAVAMGFAARGVMGKALYGLVAALTLAGIVVTFSRGGFLGMAAAVGVLAWKLGRRRRVLVLGALAAGLVLFLALAPGNYLLRLASIIDPSLDPVGSSGARRGLLIQSVVVALRHPLLGVGIGNFHNVSFSGLESHNAYTQVASELGLVALYFYLRFMTVPLRRLREIERETYAVRRTTSRLYYLAVGLQASLVGFMVSSFFGSVAYYWYIYYLVGYAVCLQRIYEATRDPLAAGAGDDAAAPALAEGRRHGWAGPAEGTGAA